jgi:hypothetical protein
MGAYFVLEDFDNVDDTKSLARKSWFGSQVMLVGGDASVGS